MRTRTPTPHRAFTGAALAALLLAACSDVGEPSRPPTPVIVPDATTAPPDADPTSSPPDVAPTTEQPPPPTATTTPPEDTETTTAPPAADRPEMPEVANENSTEGAEAYAVHYLETVAWLATDPQEGILEEFRITDSCELCSEFASLNSDQVQRQARYASPIFILGVPETVGDGGQASLMVEIQQPEMTEVRAGDGPVESQPSLSLIAGVDLTWRDGAWSIDMVYVVEN